MKKRDLLSDRASLENLCELLRALATQPEAFSSSPEVLSAISSQGSLAAFRSDVLGIQRMSLNHQKAACRVHLGGFETLDSLRREAVAAVRRWKQVPPGTRRRSSAELRSRIAQLQYELEVLREDLFLLQRSYDLRCQHARFYAEQAGGTTVALCIKEQRELDIMLTTRRIPRAAPRLVGLAGGKGRA